MSTSNTYDFSLTNADIVANSLLKVATKSHYKLRMPTAASILSERFPDLSVSQIDHAVKFAVYCAVNLVNGKIYVGATSKGIGARRSNHFCRAGRGEDGVFIRAINKYGRTNFEFVMIKRCVDWGDALESERIKIAELSPEYNATDGGGGVFGLVHTDVTKAKMSAAKLGKPSVWTTRRMPDEIRERIAEVRRSERGRKVTDPDRLQELKQITVMMNERRRKRVRCRADGKEYGSLTEAAVAYGLTTGAITYLCKNGKPRRGLSFEYIEGM